MFFNFELAWQIFFAAILSDFADCTCDALKDRNPSGMTNASLI